MESEAPKGHIWLPILGNYSNIYIYIRNDLLQSSRKRGRNTNSLKSVLSQKTEGWKINPFSFTIGFLRVPGGDSPNLP